MDGGHGKRVEADDARLRGAQPGVVRHHALRQLAQRQPADGPQLALEGEQAGRQSSHVVLRQSRHDSASAGSRSGTRSSFSVAAIAATQSTARRRASARLSPRVMSVADQRAAPGA